MTIESSKENMAPWGKGVLNGDHPVGRLVNETKLERPTFFSTSIAPSTVSMAIRKQKYFNNFGPVTLLLERS